MFKMHRKVKYALVALKHMQSKPADELTTAKEICTRFDIPFDPTSRVLQIMTQHKILKAEQGAYGGYKLAQDLSKITIFELSRMIVGPLAITNCSAEKGKCNRLDICVLKDPMAKLNARLVKVFKDVQVSEMI